MNVPPRRLLIGALILFLLNSACNMPGRALPTPVGTILPDGQASSTLAATGTLISETSTASIPITGAQEVSLLCQFCVNDEPHAALTVPETADFNVAGPLVRVNCITAQVVNGRRILLCRGEQQTSFSLNVCQDGSDCTQFPVMLETCPLAPQAGTGTQPVILASPTPVVVTPIFTPTQPAPPAATAILSPTPTGIFPLPATATTAPSLQPTQTLTPTTRQPRASGLQDPEGFARWYFGAVWQGRNYQDLWDNYQTLSFRNRPGGGSYEDYVEWWRSVERVDVNSVEVIQNDGTHAWIRVNVSFTMRDDRVISNQEYDYKLLYDPGRGTWMFDYRT